MVTHGDIWQCKSCGKVWAVPSLARDCEKKDAGVVTKIPTKARTAKTKSA